MPIYRLLDISNQTKKLPEKALGYTLNPQKTNETLIAGIGCLPNVENALRSMELTKAIHRKTDGKQIIHSVLSFDAKEPVTEQEVLSISKQIAREVYRGYQCVIAVHTNTVHLHSHFVVNSVDAHGRRFNLHRKEFFKHRNTINQILIRNGKNPITGFSEDDYREREFSDEDIESGDWMELYPENERVVIMSGNTLPDITLAAADGLYDDECDDEPSLSQCYFLTLAQKHGFVAARCICDAELYHQDDNYEEDNDMSSKPTIRIGGGVIITTDTDNLHQNADLYSDILKGIPEDIRATHDIEIYAPNEIHGVSPDVVDEIARRVSEKKLYKMLPQDKKQ